MPRIKKPKMARVAPVRKEEEPLRPVPTPLIMEERDELTRILATPAFVKAMRNARCLKPSAFTAGCNGQFGQLIATNRLHEIRGWEAFEFALFEQVKEPVQRPKPATESFPSGGTIDAAFEEQAKRTLPKDKPKAIKTI